MNTRNDRSVGALAVRWTAKVLKTISFGAARARRELRAWEMRRVGQSQMSRVGFTPRADDPYYEPGDTVSDPVQAA